MTDRPNIQPGSESEAFKPITMQDVRLVAGEGKLPAWAVLQACNTIIRQRFERSLSHSRPMSGGQK